LKTFVKNRQKIGLHLGGILLEMDPIFKNFTPALRLLTYSQQSGTKSGLISPTVSEICRTAHLTPRKGKNFSTTSCKLLGSEILFVYWPGSSISAKKLFCPCLP